MPGVSLAIRNNATGTERTVVSDASGKYVAASLPPGIYTVVAHLEGFGDQTRGIELGVAQTVSLDLQMRVQALAENVTVVDQSGTLLSAPNTDDPLAASSRQLDYQRRIEKGLEDRIEALLSPLVGDGRVRASVTADLDFSATERTSEAFDPAQQIVRSEQTSSDQNSGGDLAQGVPGGGVAVVDWLRPGAVRTAEVGAGGQEIGGQIVAELRHVLPRVGVAGFVGQAELDVVGDRLSSARQQRHDD